MTDESYELHEVRFPSEREEALMAPAKNDKLVGKTGREVAQAVLDGQAPETWSWAREPSRPTSRTFLLKLDLRDRVQAVIYAYESGMVQPGA